VRFWDKPEYQDLKQLGRRRSPYSIEEPKLEFETQHHIHRKQGARGPCRIGLGLRM